jgi:hypothetical protein
MPAIFAAPGGNANANCAVQIVLGNFSADFFPRSLRAEIPEAARGVYAASARVNQHA